MIVSNAGRRRAVTLGVAALVAAIVGCGEEEDPPEPPQFAAPIIECADSQDPDVEGRIVSEVSIQITDPDRDLLTDGEDAPEGTFDSLPIVLTDEDADQRFSWQPSEMENRIRCEREHHLVVHARDAEGNEETFDERITKDGDS